VSQPRLIVFDLDFTLWDCGGTWCDCLSPPFRSVAGKIVDRGRRQVQLYRDVLSILDECDRRAIQFAVASRTEQPSWARELLNLLDIDRRFVWSEIFPASKLQHFERLQRSSGLAYRDMLFFDDELRNIREVSRLGVTCVHVEAGLDQQLFASSLRRFAKARESQTRSRESRS
jgi:magnesium-dependent phosphatase 1